jgi:predicted SAM-dependent methyltransferase
MKNFLINLVRQTGTEELAHKLLFLICRVGRNLRRADKRILEKYRNTSDGHRKLHIGCGSHILPGWLNTDYITKSKHTKSKDVFHLDATKPFPFKDNEFEYIFSEHMIEHITYLDGMNMLKESFRVLKPGGILRIATPDLSFLIELFKTDKTKLQKDYIVDSTNRYISYVPFYDETFVTNNYVRAWGHKFIYSEKILRHSLENAGFKKIIRLDVSESQDENLGNLENVGRKPEGMIKMETLVLEGMKQ